MQSVQLIIAVILFFDKSNRVLCMPSTWLFVPDELKDLEVHKATASALDCVNENVIDWRIEVNM